MASPGQQATKRGRRGRKCFQSIEAEKTPFTRRHSPRPVSEEGNRDTDLDASVDSDP